MKTENIGIDAGIIWHEINASGNMSIKQIKKGTKMDLNRIYLALGWLAREDKIIFDTIDDELSVILIY